MAKKADSTSKSADTPEEKGDLIKVRIKDVAAPGETAPDASSKPIIVTNRPIMKDTMVKEQAGEGEDQPKTSLKRSAGEAVIQPLKQEAEGQKEETPEEEAAPAKTDDTKEEPKEESPAAAQAPEATAQAAEQEQSATEEPAPAEEADEQGETKEPAKKVATADEAAVAEAAEAKKQAEHDAAIQKLADSKKYELPINAVEKRRSKRVAFLGLILSVLLLLAWVDIAVDAGIVHISGVKPVTHFFSN